MNMRCENTVKACYKKKSPNLQTHSSFECCQYFIKNEQYFSLLSLQYMFNIKKWRVLISVFESSQRKCALWVTAGIKLTLPYSVDVHQKNGKPYNPTLVTNPIELCSSKESAAETKGWHSSKHTAKQIPDDQVCTSRKCRHIWVKHTVLSLGHGKRGNAICSLEAVKKGKSSSF